MWTMEPKYLLAVFFFPPYEKRGKKG